jgi:DNA-binding NtrC family response regulator
MNTLLPPESSPKLVVLVEDHFLIRNLTAELLRDAAFVVFEAGNAEEALQILSNVSATINVLFTDMQMPGDMQGLELIWHAHKTWPWIALLLASGYPPPSLSELPVASRFLAKPYASNQMVGLVEELAVSESAVVIDIALIPDAAAANVIPA